MKCTRCNAMNTDGAEVCAWCGMVMAPPKPEAAVPPPVPVAQDESPKADPPPQSGVQDLFSSIRAGTRLSPPRMPTNAWRPPVAAKPVEEPETPPTPEPIPEPKPEPQNEPIVEIKEPEPVKFDYDPGADANARNDIPPEPEEQPEPEQPKPVETPPPKEVTPEPVAEPVTQPIAPPVVQPVVQPVVIPVTVNPVVEKPEIQTPKPKPIPVKIPEVREPVGSGPKIPLLQILVMILLSCIPLAGLFIAMLWAFGTKNANKASLGRALVILNLAITIVAAALGYFVMNYLDANPDAVWQDFFGL